MIRVGLHVVRQSAHRKDEFIAECFDWNSGMALDELKRFVGTFLVKKRKYNDRDGRQQKEKERPQYYRNEYLAQRAKDAA